MRFKIDSFQVFLTQFDPSKITQVKPKDPLVTGSNPFTTFYNDPPANAEMKTFQIIRNKSDYEVIVLEHIVVYDSIKMPTKAHYIKPFSTLQLNTSDQAKRILNFYAGRKLASFQDPTKHYFIGNHSEVEYRFSVLAPNAKALLQEDCLYTGTIELLAEREVLRVTEKEGNSVAQSIQDKAVIKLKTRLKVGVIVL
jgi:hypothetical protein